MSNQVFPTLPVGFSLTRSPEFKTRKPISISGKETAINDWPYPRYTWDLVFETLRQGTVTGNAYSDFSELFGFYNARLGGFDSFLYTDAFDNSATNIAMINTSTGLTGGDGSTTTFQLVSSFGSFAQPCYAPNVLTNVKDNGSIVSATVTGWGTSTPGIVTYGSAPAAGHTTTATFTYYFPVRFVDDKCEFEQFDNYRFTVKKLSFKSII